MRGIEPVNNFDFNQILLYDEDGNGVDLTNAYILFRLTESIESTVNCSIDIIDTIDIKSKIDLSSNLSIKLSFNSLERKEYEKVFHVRDISELKDSDTQKRAIVRFECVSIFYRIDSDYRVSKSYNQIGTHLVVREMLDLLEVPTKNQFVEKTLYNRDFIIPNMSPLRAISYLKKYSQSGDPINNQDPTFLFYENKDGFHFRSLMSLINARNNFEYSYGPTNSYSPISAHTQIISLEIPRSNYHLYTLESGGYGTTQYNHSILNKSYIHNKVTLKELSVDFKMLNNKQPFRDSDSNSVANQDINSFDGFYYSNNPQGDNFAIRKVCNNKFSKQVFCRIPMNTEMTVGDKIFVNATSIGGDNDVELTGYWLIDTINYMVNREMGYMDLKLISDSIAGVKSYV